MMLKAPYPYFGGKSTVADIVWRALGDVDSFIDPFMGSAALLLGRPSAHLKWGKRREIVNDIDALLVNAWRAISAEPDSVAQWADNPVFESDLHARHSWLVNQKDSIRARIEGDPDYYDAKAAGWWLWGASCWIGSGWCSGEGPWRSVDGQLVRVSDGGQIASNLPHLNNEGRGVNRKLPHIGDNGKDVNRKRLHMLSEKGVKRNRPQVADGVGGLQAQGITRQMRHLTSYGQGTRAQGIVRKSPEVYGKRGVVRARANSGLYAYMQALSARLTDVTVLCGDWTRCLTPSVCWSLNDADSAKRNHITGVVLDPPYNRELRDANIYANESDVSDAVREWAIANGERKNLRIALFGYADEHEMPANWTRYQWSANGGYSNQGSKKSQANRHKETVWFSPHCLPIAGNASRQLELFGGD